MAALEELIPLVNKLQDLVFNTIGTDTIDLPQVVVVGSQSSGKTSVLENLVGKEFLPRGSGIVTRRPLILQLINTSKSNDNNSLDSFNSGEYPPAHYPNSPAFSATSLKPEIEEWGEFLHISGKRYTDFAGIRREIEAETARVAGQNKGINRLPIHLKVYSPKVLNLTLVDLPGLTKIPIGDQPSDIERQVRSLVIEYIAKPNSIILAVTPANIDLVNSEGLKLARHVDSQGKRTIGVLTKLDLMDHGTNALEILSGRVYPLKLGFIGIVNRSQQDIMSGKSLNEALSAEEIFFRSNVAYRNIAHRCGTRFLAKSLNTILMQHIREKLPDIKARLNTLVGQTQQELLSYGDAQFSGKQHRGTLILQLMTRFATSFVSSIDGTSSEISTKELCGGARIYYIFNNVFGSSLDAIDATSNLTIHDIQTAIRNSTGPRPSLFVPEMAFDLLIKPQVKLLDKPSQRCVELVYEELMKICHSCGSAELKRFPKLQTKLIEVVSELLRERLAPTYQYVESLIAIQGAYINTNHPNFLGGAKAMSSAMNDKEGHYSRRQRHITDFVKSRKAIEKSGHQDTPVNGVLESQQMEGTDPTFGKKDDKKPSDPASSDIPNGLHQSPIDAMSGTTVVAAKETFLNYFFGNSGPPDNMPRLNYNTKSSRNQAKMENNSRATVGPPERVDISDQLDHTMRLEPDKQESTLTEREQIETDLIRSLISSYFHIVRETIQDLVPKAVMHLLVNHCKEVLQTRLVAELYREDLFNELLHEDETLAQERAKCEQLLSVYREAARVITEVQ